MDKNYKPNPLEYFHGRVAERFHEWRRAQTTETTVPIDGICLNDIVAKAKVDTYNEYPELKTKP